MTEEEIRVLVADRDFWKTRAEHWADRYEKRFENKEPTVKSLKGKLKFGMNREEVTYALGPPDDTGGTSKKYRTPSVYKYGDTELWFEPWKDGTLHAVRDKSFLIQV